MYIYHTEYPLIQFIVSFCRVCRDSHSINFEILNIFSEFSVFFESSVGLLLLLAESHLEFKIKCNKERLTPTKFGSCLSIGRTKCREIKFSGKWKRKIQMGIAQAFQPQQ